MPLLDRFVDVAGHDAVNSVRRAQAELAASPVVPDHPTFYRRLRLHPDYVDVLSSPMTPPGGIFGVGLWEAAGGLHPAAGELAPAVFVVAFSDLEEEVRAYAPLDESDAAPLILERLGFLPEQFIAVELPPPDPQTWGPPGSGIECMGNFGRLGIPVWTRSGDRGVTTAGHVATSVGATVRHGGEVIGYVATTDYPARHNPGVDCADLAVITLHPRVRDLDDGLAGVGTAVQYDPVEAVLAPDGASSGWVRGVSESWANTPSDGSWGDVLITNRAISAPGDSGAPCLHEDQVVGHVVAGADPAYTLVQDVSFQLTRSGVRPRFA
jgi:hypothetical protein